MKRSSAKQAQQVSDAAAVDPPLKRSRRLAEAAARRAIKHDRAEKLETGAEAAEQRAEASASAAVGRGRGGGGRRRPVSARAGSATASNLGSATAAAGSASSGPSSSSAASAIRADRAGVARPSSSSAARATRAARAGASARQTEEAVLVLSQGSEVAEDADIRSGLDWTLLQDGQWLNDALLDFFIGNLVKELDGSRKVHAFSAQFFTQLSKGARDGYHGWDDVKRWTKGVKDARGPRGIFACNYLLLPVHCRNKTHWSLAVVSRPWAGAKSLQDRSAPPTLTLLDSLGASPETEATKVHVRNFLCGYLAHEWQALKISGDVEGNYDASTLAMASCTVGLQANSSDCGIFVLEFVLELLRRPELLEGLGRPDCHPICAAASCDPQLRARWRRAGAALQSGEPNWLPEELRLDRESDDRPVPASQLSLSEASVEFVSPARPAAPGSPLRSPSPAGVGRRGLRSGVKTEAPRHRRRDRAPPGQASKASASSAGTRAD
eukprot:TRINITY_DN4411_c0_g1_i1.p1 TRINITY_DN4411_c0_g1~~TRINITY_DN4411_c0_g1_i1.p1  ORF type:complete len:496 (-),score=119.80 TRINITY_DN4411_c0_g1_i1:95-1582(-)